MFQAGYFLWINKVQHTFYFQDQELTAIEIKKRKKNSLFNLKEGTGNAVGDVRRWRLGGKTE